MEATKLPNPLNTKMYPHLRDPREFLLKMKNVPAHMIAGIQTNEASSPLLRLPKHIRLKVLHLASAHHIHGNPPYFYIHDTNDQINVFTSPLRQVCRRLYIETCMLQFYCSIFIIDFQWFNPHAWVVGLTPCHRQFIRFLYISSTNRAVLTSRMFEHFMYAIHRLFPNLVRIEIGAHVVKWIREDHGAKVDPEGKMTNEGWKVAILDGLRRGGKPRIRYEVEPDMDVDGNVVG